MTGQVLSGRRATVGTWVTGSKPASAGSAVQSANSIPRNCSCVSDSVFSV